MLRASDPGYGRLRQALAGAGSMATALPVGYAYARIIDADHMIQLISMLLAAIVSMIGSMALTGPDIRPKIRTAVGFPVALGGGLTAGALLAGTGPILLAVFVLVVFLAVFIRRFGMPFYFYGFMMWIGYFFASFLRPEPSMLPELIGAAAVGSAWVLLLSATVFRTRPQRVLRDVRRTFTARAFALVGACTAVLDAAPGKERRKAVESIHAHTVRVQETALMIEAWSGDASALPPGWTALEMRRRTLDWSIALDSLAACAETLAEGPDGLRSSARTALAALADSEFSLATAAAESLRRTAREVAAPAGCPVTTGRLRLTGMRLAANVDDVVGLLTAEEPAAAATGTDAHAGPAGGADADPAFEPAVALMMGNLPGSPSVARDVDPHVGRRNPLRNLSFTSRQAVQVAIACGLAIWIGSALNETRYYWAVIAAFIAFTGTGSRSETFIKSANRVIGTLAGLVAGIWVAHQTVGNTPLMVTVIVLSIFCGLYLVRINYSFMIFFITIMVSQLYGILHEFSDELLVLRLEETIIGAVCGIAVALVIAPLSTRDTVEYAQANLLTAVADLLDAAAGVELLDDDGNPRATDTLVMELDDRLRQLRLVAAPLMRPLLWDNSPRATRHRLTVYGGIVRMARAAAVIDSPDVPSYRLASAVARAAAEAPGPLGSGAREPDDAVSAAVARADARLESLAMAAPAAPPARMTGGAEPAGTRPPAGDPAHTLIPVTRVVELIAVLGEDSPRRGDRAVTSATVPSASGGNRPAAPRPRA